ncbi:PopZ family protein [uncultured Alsobacter sp.]|uniref:PopZ family protein n=1 Tax=uncultured Alsobacter sp. TaxID=1748258 RepID=UPI0025D45D54|nr:DUF2497 domain-containing protein [uncultured Alsobacter sp.]
MSASLKANEPSMEEILASIRRIIADDTGGEAPPAAAPEPEPEPPAAVVEDDSDVLDLATVAKPEPAPADDIEFREIEEPLLVLPKMPEPEPEPEPEPVFVPPPPPVQARAVPPPPAESLLSSETNSAVASQFDALGSAILAQNARTLDDLVKDMLRPMLKSWLDQNLPSLVERLVRAEIERVSKGSRG